MNDLIKWTEILTSLVEKNFEAARTYRQSAEILSDVLQHSFLIKLASQRFNFALELGKEIHNLGINSFPFIKNPNQFTPKKVKNHSHPVKAFKFCINTEKTIAKAYQKALRCINEGTIREILLRHKSLIMATLKELKIRKQPSISSLPGEKIKKVSENNNREISQNHDSRVPLSKWEFL